MTQIITNITLDVLTPAAHPKTVYAKQHDQNSRYICASITNNGNPLPIETSAAVYLNGTRSDKQKGSFQGTVNADGTLMLPIDSWLLRLVGSVECDVLIQSDSTSITTMSFMLVVLESSYSSETPDSGGSGDSGGAVTPIQPQNNIATLDEVKTYLGV